MVAERGRLIDALPGGATFSVALDEAQERPHLRDGLCRAVLNGPSVSVVSGPAPALEALQEELVSADAGGGSRPRCARWHPAFR